MYHILARVILEKNAIELYKGISEKLKNKNSLESFVDAEGFTPFLRLIQTFANGAKDTLNVYLEEAKSAKLEEKQREWDKTHKTTTANGTAAAATSLRGGARTFQTARKTVGRLRPSQAAVAAEENNDDPFDTRPVNLTKKEIDDAHIEAEEKFQGFVDTIIEVCRDLINLGARPEDTVQKLKKFVADESKRTSHAQQIKLLERIVNIAVQNSKNKNAESNDEDEEEDNNPFGRRAPRKALKSRHIGGLFGGGFGFGFGHHHHHHQQQQV